MFPDQLSSRIRRDLVASWNHLNVVAVDAAEPLKGKSLERLYDGLHTVTDINIKHFASAKSEDVSVVLPPSIIKSTDFFYMLV